MRHGIVMWSSLQRVEKAAHWTTTTTTTTISTYKGQIGKFFLSCLSFVFLNFLLFSSVILVPELFRKVRETGGINFHQVSSIYVGVVSSYEQKTEKVNEC